MSELPERMLEILGQQISQIRDDLRSNYSLLAEQLSNLTQAVSRTSAETTALLAEQAASLRALADRVTRLESDLRGLELKISELQKSSILHGQTLTGLSESHGSQQEFWKSIGSGAIQTLVAAALLALAAWAWTGFLQDVQPDDPSPSGTKKAMIDTPYSDLTPSPKHP